MKSTLQRPHLDAREQDPKQTWVRTRSAVDASISLFAEIDTKVLTRIIRLSHKNNRQVTKRVSTRTR